MRVVMDFHRDGAHYVGTLTRDSDRLRVPFWGVLELLAALELVEEPDSDDAHPPKQMEDHDA